MRSEPAQSAVAAIILAAGRGRRFDAAPDGSKVVAPFAGMPMVRRVATLAQASRAAPVIVVTGHAAPVVESALEGIPTWIVNNPGHAAGMSGSLQIGLAALPPDPRGALILLADMPLVRRDTLDRLIARFEAEAGPVDAVIPTYEGRPGNPVLIGRRLFAAIGALRGDEGARKLLAGPERTLIFCEVEDPGIEIDVDTRDTLTALTRRD